MLNFVVCVMRLLPRLSVAQIFTPITSPARSHCILSIRFNKRMGCLLGGWGFVLRKKAFRVGSVRLTGMRACCARGAVPRGGVEGWF